MSQHQSPRSPRTPRSKSQSCDEGEAAGEENVPTVNEIQAAVAEELNSPDRIISQAQQSIRSRGASPNISPPAQSFHGTAPQSRGSYPSGTHSRPPTAPQSRIPSPRSASTYEEPPKQPSAPLSPAVYASRAAFLGAVRAPSSEASQRSKPISFQEMVQNQQEDAALYPEDEALPPDVTYERGPSQPSMRTTPAASHPSMRGSPPYSHPSMRGSPAYSQASRQGTSVQPSMRQMADPSQCSRGTPGGSRSAATGTPAASHPSMRGSPPYSHTSMRGSPAYSQASRQGTSVQPSMRQMADPSQCSRGTPGGSRSAATGNCVCPSMVAFGEKGQAQSGIPGIGTSTSGMNPMGVDAATSAMSYGSARSGALAGGIPGCSTFMRDIQNAASSTPYGKCNEPMLDGLMQQRQPPMGSPAPGGFRHPQHQRVHEMPKKTFPVPAASPTFDRTPTPSAYMRPLAPDDGEHHHHHHDEGHEGPQERDERVVAALAHLSQFKKTPSYFRCGTSQDLDFLKICRTDTEAETAKYGAVAAFPDIPCLCQEDLDELVKCETADVESTWFLASDERKTYKKPCPKQQKAQMSVKALVQAHEKAQTCGKEYSPLEHPDPEDISPEVAAAMMFSLERGIKLEECPHYTITSLFPDEPKPPFPEKIPASSISIVDRNSRDQEEMIEKSASVPSEGVSDSAYTRTMKEKGGEDMGAQRSFDVDFAIGQSKREYVLVTQKPQRVNKVQFRGGNSPPWFPGYFSAFPNEVGLKTVSSPSDLLHKAWIHSNPRNMPTGDVIILD